MSVFVHAQVVAQGIKTVYTGGEGQKMAKFFQRSCWMTPNIIVKYIILLTITIISRGERGYNDVVNPYLPSSWFVFSKRISICTSMVENCLLWNVDTFIHS
jgi:hypothetical protein